MRGSYFRKALQWVLNCESNEERLFSLWHGSFLQSIYGMGDDHKKKLWEQWRKVLVVLKKEQVIIPYAINWLEDFNGTSDSIGIWENSILEWLKIWSSKTFYITTKAWGMTGLWNEISLNNTSDINTFFLLIDVEINN